MSSYMNNEAHEIIVQNVCNYACGILKYPNLKILIMRRVKPVGKNRGYVLGHTSIGGNTITLDIYTARLRKPKKISSILSVLAHEIAHHQKKPYRQWYKGRWIIRQHFPKFYKQVIKNMARLKKDKMLEKYFTN